MLLAHAVALSRARSHVAALADLAQSFDAAVDYEQVLFQLDWIHGDDTPALDTDGLAGDRNVLFAVAASTIEELGDLHGVEGFQIELVLAMLQEAHNKDAP